MATDLSARCDRALARAAQLADVWQSTLIAAHVVSAAEVAHRERPTAGAPSWRRPEPWTQTLQRRLEADLSAEGIQAEPRVVIGAPEEVVQQAVANAAAGLVVLGVAKDSRMGRIQMGSTADALVRSSLVPVLNVRSRARDVYRHVVVTTDFSAPSLQALRLAACWFGAARLTVFHAYTPASGTDPGSEAEESWRAAVVEEFATYVADAGLPAATAASMERVIERGQPGALLADYITSTGVDLVVLGSHGRSGLARALLGSTAEHLLHSLDCDTLVVRGV
ncbi:MAG: universal stress protein [Roseateles sp.]|uniref:universal stress protein n=1 Tax=Roseateles sp. TaxID=1971397 RepID=UPI004036B748